MAFILLVVAILTITMVVVGCKTAATTETTSAAKTTTAVGSETTAAQANVSYKFDELFQQLPFKDILPLPDGPVLIDGKEKPIKLGFSQTGFNHPWRISMNNSILAEVERYNNVSVVMTDGNVDVVKQNSDVDDLIAQGCDAIILSPIDSTALKAAADKAMKANIPLIVLDRDVYTQKTVFIGQNNIPIGKALGEYMAKLLNGKGNVVEITGLIGTAVALDRQKGFRDAIANFPDIKVLAEGDGGFIREPASKLMDDWLTAFPKIDAVYSHAEESAWGAVLAIQRAKREGDNIMQFTIDASNEGFRSVKSGQFTADGNYTPYIGQVGVRAALYCLMKKDLIDIKEYQYGNMIELPELPIVTSENIDEWLGKGWGE